MILIMKSRNGKIIREEVNNENLTLTEAKEIFNSLLFTVIEIEDNKYGDWSNDRACQILANEGTAYAVQFYCRSSEFKDPITRDLWDKAESALNNLEEYVGLSNWEDIND